MAIAEETIVSILEGCLRNHRQSQQSLYEWLKNDAVRTCYRYARNNYEAEEMVTEGFVKLFKNISQFRIDRNGNIAGHFHAWFRKIMVHNCIDWLRKTHHDLLQHAHDPETVEMPSKEASAEDMLSHREIIACIRNLSPVYRSVFNLYVIEGYNHEEIGQMLGIAPGTSKSNLFKAKENLRKMILQQRKKTQYA